MFSGVQKETSCITQVKRSFQIFFLGAFCNASGSQLKIRDNYTVALSCKQVETENKLKVDHYLYDAIFN